MGNDEIKRKRGRPGVEGSRKKQYRLMMSDEEFAKLEEISEALGKSKASVIRQGILTVGAMISERHIDEQYDENWGDFDDDFE